MNLPSRIETVVIGGGQSGLAMSWYLTQGGREHVVLERRASPGGGWQDRWDAFRLVTPNWAASFPGSPYAGDDPDGFMPRDQIVDRVAGYGASFGAPVVLETEVRRLTGRGGGDGFRLETNHGAVEAERVVVATGAYHLPRIPPFAAGLPGRLKQLHSHGYRNPAQLPPGAVLVVGSAQSGVQIAEELQEAGRRVYLAVGKAGRVPRRYRGRDLFRWLLVIAMQGDAVGVPMPTVDRLPDPRMRFAPNPHLSGHRGGHDTNLRQMAAGGITLLGRIEGADGERLRVAADLSVNLAAADRFFDERMRDMIDTFIERTATEAPPDDRVAVDFEPPELRELDLDAAGISTVIWTTGYGRDYGWIDLPILDEMGIPRQARGVSDIDGLFFLGVLWQYTMASATLGGVNMDAPYLARRMGLPVGDARPQLVS